MPETIRCVKLADGRAELPVVLCIPGAICPPEVFAEMAPGLGCETHAFAWLEGDGPHDLHTVAARIAAVASRFREVVLVGHSIGVPLAVLAASQCRASSPGKVAGLVLSNSGANTAGHGDIDAIIRKVLAEWGPAFWEQFMQRCIGTQVSDQMLTCFRSYPPRLDPSAVADAIRSQKTIDLLPLLPGLGDVPVAVVHGRMDVARTLAHAQEMAHAIPGASLHVLETGHTSAAEAPSQFAGIVLSVLERRT